MTPGEINDRLLATQPVAMPRDRVESAHTGPYAPAVLLGASFLEYVFPPFPGDVLVTFCSKQLGAGWDDICCRMYGTEGTLSVPDPNTFGVVPDSSIVCP